MSFSEEIHTRSSHMFPWQGSVDIIASKLLSHKMKECFDLMSSQSLIKAAHGSAWELCCCLAIVNFMLA